MIQSLLAHLRADYTFLIVTACDNAKRRVRIIRQLSNALNIYDEDTMHRKTIIALLIARHQAHHAVRLSNDPVQRKMLHLIFSILILYVMDHAQLLRHFCPTSQQAYSIKLTIQLIRLENSVHAQ